MAAWPGEGATGSELQAFAISRCLTRACRALRFLYTISFLGQCKILDRGGLIVKTRGLIVLTERRQQQAIVDLIFGFEPELPYQTLSKPYRVIWQEVQRFLQNGLDSHDIFQEMYRFKLSELGEPLADLIDAILVLEPGFRQNYLSLQEIGPDLPQTTWFWPDWIPRGLLTLLAAWPGVGKTYLALDLAHRVISDLPAPDESPFAIRTGRVIYVDAEDFLPDIYERAVVWGMDLDKFYPIRRPPRDLIDMSRPEYQDPLIDICFDLQPDLVIVDSLSSVNIRGENNIEDLRDVLGFFIELAGTFDVALLLIHHLRKPNKGMTQPVTMHDLRGSGHLVAMARSILGIDIIKTGPEEDLNGPRQLKVLKKNRGKYPKPLSIQYNDSPTNPDVAVLSYGPIALFERYPETLTEKCATWLVDLLEERGPTSFAEIQTLAAQEEFRYWVLIEARQILGDKVVDTLGPKRLGNKWALADHPIDDEQPELEENSNSLVRQCMCWLTETLEGGPLSYIELKRRAILVGFKENTIQNARKLCPQIVDTVGPRRKGNKWALKK